MIDVVDGDISSAQLRREVSLDGGGVSDGSGRPSRRTVVDLHLVYDLRNVELHTNCLAAKVAALTLLRHSRTEAERTAVSVKTHTLL